MTALQENLVGLICDSPKGWGGNAAGEAARLALLDALACSLGAARNESVRQVAAAYQHLPSTESCWFAPAFSDAEQSAMSAAVAVHALDFDDVATPWRGHPSAVIYPALFASALQSATLGDVLDAYVIGFEVGARIGTAVGRTHYERGWHATSTIGVVAAASACARLHRLDAQATSAALSLAVAQAGGVQANFGTPAKSMQAGFAAAGAIRALALARAGVHGSENALDGPAGFGDLYGFGLAPVEVSDAQPSIINGLEIKEFPNCYAAHRAVRAALALRTRTDFDLSSIVKIHITGSAGAHKPLLTRAPESADEARFSVEFAVACALLTGRLGLDDFVRSRIEEPQLKSLMARTVVAEDRAPSDQRWGEVKLTLADGSVVSQRVVGLERLRYEEAQAFAARKIDSCMSAAGLEPAGADLLSQFSDLSVSAGDLFQTGVSRRVQERLHNIWNNPR